MHHRMTLRPMNSAEFNEIIKVAFGEYAHKETVSPLTSCI